MTAAQLGQAGEPEVVVLPDPEAVSREAAARLVDALRVAIAERGRADWATTGGSAPGAIYRAIISSELREAIPWERVHVWWGDDRFVPLDHELSNVRPVDVILLAGTARYGVSGSGASGVGTRPGEEPGVRIPAGNVHPFPIPEAIGGGHPPEWCAERYAETLRTSGVEIVDGWPAFDAYLIGIGPDGHLLSVFPGSPLFDRREWALGVPAPTHVEPHVPRVTLHPRTLDVARELLVVAHGGGKAGILGRVFGDERDERALPAQVARRRAATWLLDEAAAAQIDPAMRGR